MCLHLWIFKVGKGRLETQQVRFLRRITMHQQSYSIQQFLDIEAVIKQLAKCCSRQSVEEDIVNNGVSPCG